METMADDLVALLVRERGMSRWAARLWVEFFVFEMREARRARATVDDRARGKVA